MNSAFSMFLNLPPHLRTIALVAGGGSLAVVGISLFRMLGGGFVWILIIGLIIAAIVVAGYRMWLRWREKRKARPLEQGIVDNSSVAPSSVSDPARRASLDNLRKDFEEGVAKFRAAGKDIYGLPWYLLVGEPGSGKTEAVRHCNVGFPPGLQDPQQGVGGTLNMNWWFTNQAIILDTAGRLMFEEVQTGATSEWKELLKLLNTTRNRCPINGMLLVIPADSLLKDSADQIEKKASRIAQQLDGIQRTLDVRFPVFILVTKSDIITGFREFFQAMNDPQQQHQMLGWSNSAGIDEPFQPELVESHLQRVQERLVRRRTSMLLDPPQGDDASSKRADQVDALYAFPDELLRIAPRLRRYLEMVFVAGEWSPKPLFLRGIYFTSSLQEGQELDAGLAELLGVPVESLPGESVTRKDKAYFLRDLFMEKVFPERGLVSRATNASQHHRRNKLIVLGSGVAAALIFLAMTIWFGWKFNASIGDQQRWWDSVARHVQSGSEPQKLVQWRNSLNTVEYSDATVALHGGELSMMGMMQRSAELAEADLSIPFVFRAIGWFKGWFGSDDLAGKPARAHAALVHQAMLAPLVREIRGELKENEELVWSAQSYEVLLNMIRMAASAADGQPAEAERVPDVAPLFELVLSGEQRQRFDADQQQLRHVVMKAYTGTSGESLPFASGDTTALRDAINAGIDAWSDQLAEGGGAIGDNIAHLRSLQDAFEQLSAAEEALYLLADAVQSVAQYERFTADWSTRFAAVQNQKERIDFALQHLGVEAGQSMGVFSRQQESLMQQLHREYETLRKELPQVDEEPARSETPQQALVRETANRLDRTWESVGEDLVAQWKSITDDIAARFDAEFFAPATGEGSPDRLYQRRFAMYETVNAQLTASSEAADLSVFHARLVALDASVNAAEEHVDGLVPRGQANERFARARSVCTTGLSAAGRARRQFLYEQVLNSPPNTAEEVAELVAAAAATAEPKPWPRIPLITIEAGETFKPQFDYGVAGRVVGDWQRLVASLQRQDSAEGSRLLDPSILRDRLASKTSAFNGYVELYCRYWSRDVVRTASSFAFDDWQDFLHQLQAVRVNTVNANLSATYRHIDEAVDQFRDSEFWPQGFRPRILEQRAEVNPDNDRRFEQTRSTWRNLPEDAINARDMLLGSLESDFESVYLPFNYDENDVGLNYWSALYREALDVLARTANERAARARRQLSEDRFKAFPLCRDCPEMMSLQAMEEAKRLLSELGAGQSRTERGASSNFPRMPLLQDLFVQLRGGEATRGLDDPDGLAALKQLALALGGGSYIVRPIGTSRNMDSLGLFLNIRVRAAGQPLSTWARSGSGSDAAWSPLDGRETRIGIEQQSLVFEFRPRADDDSGMYLATLPERWGLIAALARATPEGHRAEPAEADEPATVRWIVPVRAVRSDHPDESQTIWVEIEFQEPLPSPARWPTAQRWPVRAAAN